MALYDELISYTAKDLVPLHMPGHKRNPLFPAPSPYQTDITELPGFDSLYEERGPLYDLSERVRHLYQSEHSFLLVNGSTGGILTAIRSATKPGDTVLLARNCHHSVYHALSLFGLHAEYLLPDYDENGIANGFSLTQIQKRFDSLSANSCALVVLTSPTYEGRLSKIQEIAEYLHEHKIPLLVDEAHGAHLSLHPSFPGGAVTAGADMVVQSFHKTLPTLTQTAVLHVNGTLVSVDKIKVNWRMLQTSSPSFLLLSSVDRCMSLLTECGTELFQEFIENLKTFYERVSSLRTLRVLPKTTSCDPSRIVVLTPRGVSGLQLAATLKKTYGIEVEAYAPGYLIAITGIADPREHFLRFADALQSIDCSDFLRNTAITSTASQQSLSHLYPSLPMKKMDASNAEFLPTKLVSFPDALGQVSAEYLYLYPPGIPLLVPGEQITASLLGCITLLSESGFSLSRPSAADEKLIQVLK